MCGIAGILNVSSHSPVPVETVQKMVQVMKYRGPNAKGFHVDERLGTIGHARLSIIDINPVSDQPFRMSDHDLVIVFNGEIFNYIELRKELQQHGYRFRTASDTEVLLTAYHFWGDDCVNHFNGMWAFVILDSERNRVFCSRDRFGIKPFLYSRHNGQLQFASEAKAIHQANGSIQPDFEALTAVVKTSFGGENLQTCFAGISRLAPAHNLVIENGQVAIKRYWNYPTADMALSIGHDEAVEVIRELLRDAVRLRLRSDVPVGFTLSGGIDSSGVTGLAGVEPGQFHAYTAAYHHPDYPADETRAAIETAKKSGLRHHLVSMDWTDVLPSLKRVVYHLESPHASPAMLPYWKIMEVAKQDVTVMLEGQGADELFGGYVDRLVGPALLDSIRQFRPVSGLGLLGHGLMGHFGSSGSFFLGMLIKTLIPHSHKLYRRYRGDESIYQNELASDTFTSKSTEPIPPQIDFVNQHLCHHHRGGLVNLLQYSDALPMAHSIESRLPFMDYRLVELLFKLPGRYKLRGGFGKSILREVLKTVVPEPILKTRAKRGFDTPLGHWFRDHMDELVFPVLLSSECKRRGLFNSVKMEKMLRAHQAGSINEQSLIYKWMITELWFQTFIDSV